MRDCQCDGRDGLSDDEDDAWDEPEGAVQLQPIVRRPAEAGEAAQVALPRDAPGGAAERHDEL
jgi:hypothetical protein